MLQRDGINEENLFSLPTPQKRESITIFGAYAMGIDSFYWKSADAGNTKNFTAFLHQLRACFKDKTIAIILDNASFHRAKRAREFAKKYKQVKLFFLPSYSPEYNPTEQIWKWIKPLVHAAKTISEGIKELIKRFRKITWAWANKRLACPPTIGLGQWKFIL